MKLFDSIDRGHVIAFLIAFLPGVALAYAGKFPDGSLPALAVSLCGILGLALKASVSSTVNTTAALRTAAKD